MTLSVVITMIFRIADLCAYIRNLEDIDQLSRSGRSNPLYLFKLSMAGVCQEQVLIKSVFHMASAVYLISLHH